VLQIDIVGIVLEDKLFLNGVKEDHFVYKQFDNFHMSSKPMYNEIDVQANSFVAFPIHKQNIWQVYSHTSFHAFRVLHMEEPEMSDI
jgi:hypothetical protein